MDSILQQFESAIAGSPLLAFPVVWVGGLLTSFTPCVYPMIPLTISFIGAKGSESRFHAFLLSLWYVLGMAVTYATLGAIASLTGVMFGEISSSPIVYLVVANICILFGLSMFEIFTIPIPSFLGQLPEKISKKGFVGAFLMGLVSGLVAAPCTAPILGAILAYVATKQNMLFGFTLLFTFAFGMGTLLLVLGTFTGLITSLPKAGPWMAGIKKFFAAAMIVLGEYFLVSAGKLMI
ncbi:MAG: sulfite exporter TauE/SafE family protein [Armatimonadetes bacterium]|nr:sulfite exporter TauE/SafE family protein [Armatimonadota bacterium]